MAIAGKQNESGVLRYLSESYSEMKQVVWPTQEETVRLTAVVIAISVAVGGLLGLADFLFTMVVETMGG